MWSCGNFEWISHSTSHYSCFACASRLEAAALHAYCCDPVYTGHGDLSSNTFLLLSKHFRLPSGNRYLSLGCLGQVRLYSPGWWVRTRSSALHISGRWLFLPSMEDGNNSNKTACAARYYSDSVSGVSKQSGISIVSLYSTWIKFKVCIQYRLMQDQRCSLHVSKGPLQRIHLFDLQTDFHRNITRTLQGLAWTRPVKRLRKSWKPHHWTGPTIGCRDIQW